MERDAFERGNMMFRDWTDTKKLERKSVMSEITKSIHKENKMKIKVKNVKKESWNEVEEAKRDDEEELDVMMGKPKYKAGMSDFEYGEKEQGKRHTVDTGEEASLEDIEDLELDDEGGEEEVAPKRSTRQPVDKYDSAGSFDRAWKDREARLRAQSRAAADDEPMISDEELDALIAKREAEERSQKTRDGIRPRISSHDGRFR